MSSGFSTVNKDGKTIWEPGLPASVTARRVTATSTDVPAVSCDLRLTLKMSASHKAEWLEKALRAILAGKTKVQDVFNIVTHPKFASGVSEKHGKRMFQALAENMEHFSDKQRLTLSSCKLASLFHGEPEAVKRSPSRDPSPKARARSRSPSQRPGAQEHQPSPEEEDINKKQEEEKRRIEMQKRKLKEQEEKRKAKLGAAFQFEPEAEAESNKKQLQSKLEKSHRKEELPSLSRAPFGRDADPRFVEAMGGDKLLQEAHKILRHAAGSGRIENHSRSRSRRRRKSRSPRSPRSAKHHGGSKPHVRSSGSYRSPTPDGRARGQARAARKAKMIASLMGKR